jgi:hypothetical protein
VKAVFGEIRITIPITATTEEMAQRIRDDYVSRLAIFSGPDDKAKWLESAGIKHSLFTRVVEVEL